MKLWHVDCEQNVYSQETNGPSYEDLGCVDTIIKYIEKK